MEAKKIYCFCMIVLVYFCYNSAFAEHQTISIQTDLAGASAPYRRLGFELELWLYPWLAVGAGREIDTGRSSKNFEVDVDTNQALTLRLMVSGFFIKVNSLESQYSIEKKDSSTPFGTESESTHKASLTGTRTSIGYWYEMGDLFFVTIGLFQESLSTEKFTFNDGTTKEIGGSLSGPLLTLGIAF
ncbi:MAG: hypothetical protein HQM14_09220 [SAR324 cluster bacterium]|nr:hypothetical protein [SAR324 cluster bacterium]